MKKCVFLSSTNLEDFFVYDMVVAPYLESNGWSLCELPWCDNTIDWNEYDLVVVRSTWDYQQNAQAFVDCLQKIEDSSAALENSLHTMKWNISKQYLKELSDKNVPIIPTRWHDTLQKGALECAFEAFNCSEIVVKPYVSANSDFTYRLDIASAAAQESKIVEEYQTKGAMIQPFIKSVIEEGEYSLFYFDGSFSHAISKHPKQGDFRVQEEHGGHLKLVKPSNEQIALAEKTLRALPDIPLYARIDMLSLNGQFVIIELELIEPSLYFNMDDASPKRFADAILNKYGN